MIVEYVLAATMVWVARDGQVKSQQASGVYKTHQECMQTMTDVIAVLKAINQAAVIPTGVLCERRERDSKE